MRTTINTMYSMIQNNLNKITTDMASLNSQISSGQQMSKISDNPSYMVSALGMRSRLAAISQYQENLIYGDSMIAAAESALTQIKEQILEAKVTTLQAINASVNADQRVDIAQVVHNYLEQAVTMANTQINGKYIFGGYRTTGYTDVEPAPFVMDLIDGYRINGAEMPAIDTMTPNWLVQTGTLNAGDLVITNSTDGAVAINGADLLPPPALVDGLNMDGALNLRDAVNGSGLTVTSASLTTLTSGVATTAGTSTDISFDLTGSGGGPVAINVTVQGTGVKIAQQTVDAINFSSSQTGIVAYRGDGTNGGAMNSVVLRNAADGNEGAIIIENLTETGPASSGLANNGPAGQAADASHNTGFISFSSSEPFTFNDSAYTDGTLQMLGLQNGSVGITDHDIATGNPIYRFHRSGLLAEDDLRINGISVGAAQDDGISTIYANASAEAKAAAINAVSSQTGVTAEITPSIKIASAVVEAGAMDTGDLIINGIDIFTSPTTILIQDRDNAVINAINAQEGVTGVSATRDNQGTLLLKAIDGRNMHIETSLNGETLSHLNSTNPPAASSSVYTGRVQLRSQRTFILETSPFGLNIEEPGLAALGLAGGSLVSGEPADMAGDGKLSVISIAQQDGNVRYAGDRENDLEIKVGQTNALAVGRNGQEALMDTNVFTVLKKLEDNLLGINYNQVTGIHKATDPTALLNSGDTGLSQEDQFSSGTFTFTVTDHDHYPPEDFQLAIAVDVTVDTPTSIAVKMNGIPGITSYWDSDGYLHVEASDPNRYTFSIEDHTSNFLEVTGITQEDIQIQALEQSLADLDTVMIDLTTRISDFGARANRITVQNAIYDNLQLTTTENLSEKEDTDMIEALMNMQAKEVAYQAALNAAAKAMQLSLVDYL